MKATTSHERAASTGAECAVRRAGGLALLVTAATVTYAGFLRIAEMLAYGLAGPGALAGHLSVTLGALVGVTALGTANGGALWIAARLDPAARRWMQRHPDTAYTVAVAHGFAATLVTGSAVAVTS